MSNVDFRSARSRRSRRSRRDRRTSGGYSSSSSFRTLTPTDLDPEQLAELQARLADLDLTKAPTGGQGFLGGIAGAIGGVPVVGDVAGIAKKALEQIASSLIYTPAGMYYMATSLGQDVGGVARGDLDFNRTLGMGEAMGRAVYEDVRHPLRNPGYLALDALAAASLGSGAVARFSRASQAARGARGGGRPPLIEPGAPVGPTPPPSPLRPAWMPPEPITDLQRHARDLGNSTDRAVVESSADQIHAIIRKGGQEDRVTRAFDQVAPKGSEKWQSMWTEVQAAQDRFLLSQRKTTSPGPLGPLERGPEPLPGQAEIPNFYSSFQDVKAFDPKAFGGAPLVDLSLHPRLEQVLTEYLKFPEVKQMAPELRVADFTAIQKLFEDNPKLFDDLAELRQISEKGAGLTASRQQLAREATAASDEAKTAEKLLAEVGYEPVDIPYVPDEVAARMQVRSYRDANKEIRFRIYDPDQGVIDPRRGPKAKDTGVTVRQVSERYLPTPAIPVTYVTKRGELKPGPRAKPTWRVFDDEVAVSDLISNPRDATRLAQLYAAEKAAGLPMQERSLLRGSQTLGTLGEQSGALARELGKREPMTVVDALEVAREAKLRRNQAAKKAGARKKEERVDPDEVASFMEMQGITAANEDDVARVMQEMQAAKQADAPYEPDAPRDIPISETPPLPREKVDFVKSEAPEEIRPVIDEIFEGPKQKVERLRQEVGDKPKTQRQKGTSPRQLGLSDRELGINPRALRRAGLTAEQGNRLRGPLRELYEGGKVTPEEVQEVIRETLMLSDEEALRAFEAMRGGKAAGELKIRGGSLKSHFKELWGLDETQATEAADRFKRALRPISEQAKAEGRAPQRRELMAMLEEVFGPEKGREAFSRLYETKGGISPEEAFFRALFTTPPRERLHLKQPLKEDADPLQERFFEVAPLEEGVMVDLSRNPVYRGFQHWYYDWLNKAPAGSRAAKRRAKRISYERKAAERIETYLAGPRELTPEEAEKMAARGPSLGDWIDSTNQIAQIGVLYLKPAYIPPNLLGQILFTTIDHSFNPIAIARSYKLHKQLSELPGGKELIIEARRGMGEGIYQSIAPEKGAIKSVARVHGAMARGYGRLLDTPFRDVTFINEAYKEGFTSAERIAELIKSQPGDALYEHKISIFRQANKNIVDYGDLGPTEKRLIRRAIFFYPWIKGSTKWAARALVEHPASMYALTQMGREGEKRAESILGPLPSYMRGVIPVGSRDVPGVGETPLIINPTSFSVTGSAGEFLSAVKALMYGGTSSEQLSEYFTPALSAGLAVATRTDPFTGRTFNQGELAPEIFLQEIVQSMPFFRAIQNIPGIEQYGVSPGKAGLIEQGKIDPAETLLPTTRQEELGRFLTGLTPYTYNIKEGQERATAENLELRGKAAGTMARWSQTRKESLRAARKAGAVRGNFPGWVNQALQLAARRDREYDLVKQQLGKSSLDQIDLLRADLGLLVRMKRMSAQEAERQLLFYAGLSTGDIEYYRRQIRESHFRTKELYEYRRRLLDQGVDSTPLDAWTVRS